MNNTVAMTKFSKGFFWLFFSALFVILDFNIGETDIFPDLLGYVFGMVGTVYFLFNRGAIEKLYQVFIFLLSFFLLLGFTESLASFIYSVELNNPIVLFLDQWNFVGIELSTVLIGYNFSKKYALTVEKNWKILLGIAVLALIFLIALQLIPFLVQEGTVINIEAGKWGIFGLFFIVFWVVVTIYSFTTIWKTYSQAKKN